MDKLDLTEPPEDVKLCKMTIKLQQGVSAIQTVMKCSLGQHIYQTVMKAKDKEVGHIITPLLGGQGTVRGVPVPVAGRTINWYTISWKAIWKNASKILNSPILSPKIPSVGIYKKHFFF